MVNDKICKAFTAQPRDDAPPAIEVRKSTDRVPQGHNMLMLMVHQQLHKAIDDKGQKAVVKLFNSLQLAHDNLSNVAGSISHLREILDNEQFNFIMQRTVWPLIQLCIPGNLCSPADVKFEKDRLAAEETFEEECSNVVLPQPFHPKLDTIPTKYATHCEAAAVHMLLCKKFFDTKMLHAKVADNFVVHPKKLHLTVSRRKYDPGKKMTKCKTSETPKTTPKKAKKNPQDQPKGDTEENQPTTSTQDDPVDVDSDEDLPDPFGEQQHDEGELSDDPLTKPGDDEPKSFSMKDPTKTRKKLGKQNN